MKNNELKKNKKLKFPSVIVFDISLKIGLIIGELYPMALKVPRSCLKNKVQVNDSPSGIDEKVDNKTDRRKIITARKKKNLTIFHPFEKKFEILFGGSFFDDLDCFFLLRLVRCLTSGGCL